MARTVVAPSTVNYPRNTEGDVALLPDGRLLLAYTRFLQGASDFDKAEIVGCYSTDGGHTWSEHRVLQANDAAVNCMSASLLQLPEGDLLLFYLRKESATDLHLVMRRSSDGGSTFGEAIPVTFGPGYHVVNNARVVRLSTGRLMVPVARADDSDGPAEGTGHYRCLCFLSDDEGVTWFTSESTLDAAGRGAMEPGVAELADGSLLMVIRTQLGRLFFSRSKDAGVTWTAPEMSRVLAPESASTLVRISDSTDLLLVWNHSFGPSAPMGGRRTPLSCAISVDGGQRWLHAQNLENDPGVGYSYPSVTFVGDQVLFTYYANDEPGRFSLVSQTRPLASLYQTNDRLMLQGIGYIPDNPAASIGSAHGKPLFA